MTLGMYTNREYRESWKYIFKVLAKGYIIISIYYI